jgi:flavin reductase (DIM6/NTAB) family NADH-FMN oxidoreductase RutF
MKNIPLKEVVTLMEPGPLVLVTTCQNGINNIMTMGFHMMMQHNPPLIGVIIGSWDHSYKALTHTKECVIAIPGVDLMEKVIEIGNFSGAALDKFEKFGLKAIVAAKVAAPLIQECTANIECKVVDTRMVDDYDMFVLEAVKAWKNDSRKEQRIFHHKGDGTFSVDGRTINLQDRMTKWKDIVN